MRFSSRAGDATKFEKIASPARAKNRSCSRGLMHVTLKIFVQIYLLQDAIAPRLFAIVFDIERSHS